MSEIKLENSNTADVGTSADIDAEDKPFNKLTLKDRKDIKTAIKLGCNWIALSYLQNEKLILETRKLIKKDMGIISKIENKHALKNIKKIIQATDSIMIARGDLAIDIGHSEVPKVCLLYTSPSPRDLARSRMPSSA